jgi:hypothetical protein
VKRNTCLKLVQKTKNGKIVNNIPIFSVYGMMKLAFILSIRNGDGMSTARVLILVTGILEAILGIPLLGGAIVLAFVYTPLFVMLVLHIITLVFASSESKPKAGSILGIVTSVIGWIPFVGMAMHIASAIVLLITASKSENRQAYF